MDDPPSTSRHYDNPRNGQRNKRMKPGYDSAMSTKYSVDVSNRYDSLSEIDDDELETTEEIKNSQTIKVIKNPAIVVRGLIQNHTANLNNLKSKLKDDIDVKYSGNRIIIHANNSTDYDTVLESFKEAQVEHHTYTPSYKKHHKLILKGIPLNVDTSEIVASLQKDKIPVIKAAQLSKKYEERLVPLPIFIVTVENKVSIKEIVSVKRVCHCTVKWEKCNFKSDVTQCYRCQSFGHIAPNCFRTPRCVKCLGNHESKDCKKKPEDEPVCTNCKGKHPANFRGCPVYVKQMQLRRSNSTTTERIPERRIAPELNSNNFPSLNRTSTETKNGPVIWPQKNNTSTAVDNAHVPQTSSNAATTAAPRQESTADVIGMIKSLFTNININKILSAFTKFIINISAAPDSASKLSVLLESVIELFAFNG